MQGSAPARDADELRLQRLVRLPQLPVVDLIDPFPQPRLAATCDPVGTQMPVVQLLHLRCQPGLHVNAVGDVADRHVLLAKSRIQRRPHRARHLAMERRHRVGAVRQLQRQHRHAERFAGVAVIDPPERQEGARIEAERIAHRPKVLFDEIRAEPIVSRRHRGVRGEHDLRRDAAHRLVRVDAFDIHPAAHELQRRECAVPFVQVDDARHDAKRAERLDATDTEKQLLPDSNAFVPAVQTRGELAILRAVPLDVRIEQQQHVAADCDPPDACRNWSRSRFDLHDERRTLDQRGAQRQMAAVHVDVVLVLPSVAIEPLPEVSLVVIEADPDERDAEVRCALEVVPGEHAEAAGVDRNRLVEAELG